MKIFQKPKDRDFIILNLSDPQMNGFEWADDHPYAPILKYTIDQLIQHNKPDLITVTGDMAYPGQLDSYETFAQLLDSYGIPWTIVWGNHDHQSGIEPVLQAAELFKQHPLCQFEDGDPAFGNGNYILGVCDGDSPITALFMIDSHNSIEATMPNGERRWVYDKLWPDQLQWIANEAATLKAQGYKDAVMMLHMPL